MKYEEWKGGQDEEYGVKKEDWIKNVEWKGKQDDK
jgi:hypothetical protein